MVLVGMAYKNGEVFKRRQGLLIRYFPLVRSVFAAVKQQAVLSHTDEKTASAEIFN